MRILRTTPAAQAGELQQRFIGMRESLYATEYYYYPDTAEQARLLAYYSTRPDYRLELLAVEDEQGELLARTVVGRTDAWPFAFFGLFECVDDGGVFELLMNAARRVAEELGASELRGPVDFNAIHGWQFLVHSASSERWVGDPYHAPHYCTLFERAGWAQSEESFSGILNEGSHRRFIERGEAAALSLAAHGYRRVFWGEADPADLLRWTYAIVNESFSASMHYFLPLPQELFTRIQTPVVAHLRHPTDLQVYLYGDRPLGFLLTYENFIERLCDPTGKGPPPGSVRAGGHPHVKTVAVLPHERGSGMFAALVAAAARHSEQDCGRRLGWRRTNARNDATLAAQRDSTITCRYSTYAAPTRA